jgi:hypothetical protein
MAEPGTIEYENELDQIEEQKDNFLKQVTQSFTQKIDETDLKQTLNSIANSIQSITTQSVGAVVQAAIPDISSELKEISDQFVKGTDRDYEAALERLEKIVTVTGLRLSDFSEKLGNNFDKLSEVYRNRKERIKELETEKQILKEKNIYAKIVDNQQTKEKELRVLTTREQNTEIKNIQLDEKQLLKETKEFEKERKLLMKEETLSKSQSEYLIQRENQLNKEKQIIEKRKTDINFEQQRPGGFRGLIQGAGSFIKGESGSDFTKTAMSTMYETFMSPVTAAKELGRTFKSVGGFVMDLGKVVRPLLGLFMNLARVMGTFLAPIALLLVGLYALYKGVEKGVNWFKGLFGDEEEDKQKGTGKYQSLDEGTYDIFNEDMGAEAQPQSQKIVPMEPTKPGEVGLSVRGNIGPNQTITNTGVNLNALSRDFESNRTRAGANITTIAPSTNIASKTSETVLASTPLNFDPTFLNLNTRVI